MAAERVEITHPDTSGTGWVTRKQYELVWEPQGWKLAKPEEQTDPDEED